MFWSFALHILCLYSLPSGSPGAPGVRFYTPESPGAKVVNGGGFPTLEDAIELALNKPLWRLLASNGATH